MSESIYLASRYSRREELCWYREQLRGLGYVVTSRWLNGDHQISDAGLSDEHGDQGFAVSDRERYLDDLVVADTIIAFTQKPRSASTRGGRHVELGIAIGQGKRVLIVGPRENAFCCLSRVEVFPSWQDAYRVLQIERAVADARMAMSIVREQKHRLEGMREQLQAIADAFRPDVRSPRGIRVFTEPVRMSVSVEPRWNEKSAELTDADVAR